MARFEVEGKEYEVKLTFASVRHLGSLYDGGALELIGRAMTGDLDTFANIVHAGLFHTGENFSLKKIEEAIEKAFESEQLDMDAILKISNEVVVESFFFKKTVAKLAKKDPKTFEMMKEILG
ncbi:Phage protein [Niallia circulans]|uniref:tail assembly chaperone n=2 Tax=Niallia circulans TaxID=1397 RepID=UPI00077C6833|nr:tail assembly chaperone [Niallia circulans]MDR4318675.1 hypothetical protein [Niallia circulans]MED3839364.1 tail assembly chaperone [Niallia circulans]MED4245347.1 tail assembly chaperone [Niallia circulans]MED4250882.1 tail assembly chaperone [Niallia circulans]QKH60162.1 hypothetical protein FOC77_05590 [Niallia circulans]